MGLSCSFKETRTLIEITFSVMSFETLRLQNRGNRIITFSMLPSMDLRKKKKDIQRIYMSEEQRSLLCFKKMVGKVWVGKQTKYTLSIEKKKVFEDFLYIFLCKNCSSLFVAQTVVPPRTMILANLTLCYLRMLPHKFKSYCGPTLPKINYLPFEKGMALY